MINQESNNIHLTAEQLLQIDAQKKQLANLENEISIHSNMVKALRQENARLEKHHAYLEELTQSSQANVDALRKREDELKESIKESELALDKMAQDAKKLKDEQSATQEEIACQKKDLSEQKRASDTDRADIESIKSKLAAEEAVLNDKVSVLSEALKAIGN